jgi:hypothetical protein
MPLTESDYLGWYSDEITRYRNFEWRIAGYSIGAAWASVLFASAKPEWFKPFSGWLAGFIGGYVLCLLAAELHVHDRLNEYRAKRDALVAGNPDHRKSKGSMLGGGGRDILYLGAFLLFPLLVGVFAVVVILRS